MESIAGAGGGTIPDGVGHLGHECGHRPASCGLQHHRHPDSDGDHLLCPGHGGIHDNGR